MILIAELPHEKVKPYGVKLVFAFFIVYNNKNRPKEIRNNSYKTADNEPNID